MTGEQVAHSLAKDFANKKLRRGSYNAKVIFDKMPEDLSRLKATNDKLTYYEHIFDVLCFELQKHRNESHNGQPKDDCSYEQNNLMLQFFMQQEMAILNSDKSSHIDERFEDFKDEYIKKNGFVKEEGDEKSYFAIEVLENIHSMYKQIDTIILEDDRIEESERQALLSITSQAQKQLYKESKESVKNRLMLFITTALYNGFGFLGEMVKAVLGNLATDGFKALVFNN